MYYENFEKLCNFKNVKPGTVSKATGISTATLTSWKQGKYTPKQDKLQLIADYFGVSLEYIMTGKDAECSEVKMKPGINIVHKNGVTQSFDINSIIYSICEAVANMPAEQQELVNNMVGGNKKVIYIKNPHNRSIDSTELNAAHKRTDIDIPTDIDVSDNDIMDDENF